MSSVGYVRRAWFDFLSAVQFLTRIRVPSAPYTPDTLSRAVKFFPVVGLLIGASEALLHFLLSPHLPASIVALLIVVYFVAITGCLHEDGLADAADGFGGGWERERYCPSCATAASEAMVRQLLTLSLIARLLLIASLPPIRARCAIPCSPRMSCADGRPSHSASIFHRHGSNREDRDRRPGRTHRSPNDSAAPWSLAACSRSESSPFCCAASAHPRSRQRHYDACQQRSTIKRRIGGVTGDCFGATNQITEIAVYLMRGLGMRSTLLFIRHAETDMAGTFCGHSDPPVNERGHRADRNILKVPSSDESIDAIYTSDLNALSPRQTQSPRDFNSATICQFISASRNLLRRVGGAELAAD